MKNDGLMHFFALDYYDRACCPHWLAYHEGRISYSEAGRLSGDHVFPQMKPRHGGLTTDRDQVTCPDCKASHDYRVGGTRTIHPDGFTVRSFGWPVGERVYVQNLGVRCEGVVVSVQEFRDGTCWSVHGHEFGTSKRPDEVELIPVQAKLAL